MPFDISATHECVIHERQTHHLSQRERFTYTKLREQIRDLFQLAPSAPFVLTYLLRNSGSAVTIANDDELAKAHREFAEVGLSPLLVKVMQKCSPPYLRVVYRQTQHLLAISQSQPEFCYDQLHGRVRNLFRLPDSVEFAFTYEEPDFRGPHMTVANDEMLKYALEKESPNYLRLDISILQEGTANDISDSSGQRKTSKCRQISSDIVTISHNGTLRTLSLSPVELESTCEQFLSRIGEVLTLQGSTRLELSYKDIDNVGDNNTIPVTLSKGEKLKDALSRQGRPRLLEVTANSSVDQKTSYVVKVSHNGTLHRLTLCSDEFQFSYEKFRSRIRGHFRLPPSTSFVLSYIDEDQDEITIVEDEDLRDALVLQSLHPLKVNVVIIEADSDINQNPPIAQNQADSDT